MEVIVSRPLQFVDRIRSYKLEIDGEFCGEIKPGQEIRLNIPEQAKTLVAKIDWCSSNIFDLTGLQANEKLEVKNAVPLKVLIPFYSFYAISIARKRYLHIEKISHDAA